MQAVVADLLTNYYIEGSGKTVLLLHGWGDDSRTFEALSRDLAPDYQVVRLDLPGFGGTEASKEVWGLDEYADFLRKFLDKVNMRPYAVVAHSNGGSVAIKAISNQFIDTEKLVLLASAGIRDREKGKKLMLKIIAKTGKIFTFWLPNRHKKALRKLLYGVAGSDIDVAPHLQETFKKTVRQDVQADAKKMTLPTLLVYGKEDKATPPLYGEIYHRIISGSNLEFLEESGHFVHHDQSEKVTALIKDFLK